MKVQIDFDKKFSKFTREKLQIIQSGKLIEQEANSEEFKRWCLNHKYQGVNAFADTNLSNEQVYARLMEGEEMLIPGKDGVWNIKLIPYRSRKRVLGYTYRNRKEIWVNMRYYGLSWWGVDDISGNVTHEECHKLGFQHSFRREKKWPYTVPYAVGTQVRNMVRKAIAEGRGTPYVLPKPQDVVRPDTNDIDKSMPEINWFQRAWLKVKNWFL